MRAINSATDLLFRIDDTECGLLNGLLLELSDCQIEFADQAVAAALIMVKDLDSTAIYTYIYLLTIFSLVWKNVLITCPQGL